MKRMYVNNELNTSINSQVAFEIIKIKNAYSISDFPVSLFQIVQIFEMLYDANVIERH